MHKFLRKNLAAKGSCKKQHSKYQTKYFRESSEYAAILCPGTKIMAHVYIFIVEHFQHKGLWAILNDNKCLFIFNRCHT